MTWKHTVSPVRQQGRSGVVWRPPWGRRQSRATAVRRLAGPEPLEDRCLLSLGPGLAAGELETASTADTFYGGYLTVAGIYQRLEETAAAYPGIAELVDYGDSYSKMVGGVSVAGGYELAGYDLLAFRITNEAIAGPKPVLVLMAGIHAREIATPEIAMRFADWLTQNYERDADATWLVDQHEIWVLPTVNPDGHWYVELGTQAGDGDEPWLWRKNGHAYGTAAWPPTVLDHYGVDLNRNFDFRWGTQGVEWYSGSQTYPGPEAASEPETQALQQLLGNIFSAEQGPQDSEPASGAAGGIFISLHQHGELVLWPWWDTDAAAPDGSGLEAIGRKFASYNGYIAGPGAATLYYASGTADDWTYGTLGVPSFTFEMGLQFTPAYATVDELLWPQNWEAFVYAAKIARTPYATVLGPDADAVVIEAAADSFTVAATIDDTANGGQSVAAAEYYVDTPPWITGATAYALAAADGSFDSRLEHVAGSLPSEGLSPGRHVVYVRGRDGSGNWGPISAGLLTIAAWQNADNPCDVDGVEDAQALDVLILVNSINLEGIRVLPDPGSGGPPPYLDVTGDNWLTPEDVLCVINRVNTKGAIAGLAGEGERVGGPAMRPPQAPSACPPDASTAMAVDTLMATWGVPVPRPGTGTAESKPKAKRPFDVWADAFTAIKTRRAATASSPERSGDCPTPSSMALRTVQRTQHGSESHATKTQALASAQLASPQVLDAARLDGLRRLRRQVFECGDRDGQGDLRMGPEAADAP